MPASTSEALYIALLELHFLIITHTFQHSPGSNDARTPIGMPRPIPSSAFIPEFVVVIVGLDGAVDVNDAVRELLMFVRLPIVLNRVMFRTKLVENRSTGVAGIGVTAIKPSLQVGIPISVATAD